MCVCVWTIYGLSECVSFQFAKKEMKWLEITVEKIFH